MKPKYFVKSESRGLLIYEELELSEAVKQSYLLSEFIEEPVYIVDVVNGERLFKIEYLKKVHNI